MAQILRWFALGVLISSCGQSQSNQDLQSTLLPSIEAESQQGSNEESSPITPPPPPEEYTPGTSSCMGMNSQACMVFQLINNERRSHGLRDLIPSQRCVEAAQYHANDMVNRNFFSHDSPGETGRERMQRFGVTGYRAENINNTTSVARAVESWMNSPGHRANILSDRARYTGVGYQNNMYVQCFSSNP